MGATKYGTRLQPFNGRDSMRDAYEESMDLVVYLRNAIEELPSEVPPTRERRNLNRMYQSALNLMCAMRDYQDWKEATRSPAVESDRDVVRKIQEQEAMARGHQRLDALRAQEATGEDPGSVWIDSSFRPHHEHTGHPGTPQGDVQVVSQSPTIFIPPDLPPVIQESIEQWKAQMDESLRVEQARHMQDAHPDSDIVKPVHQFGDFL
jgi:hypothetical protein